MAIRENIVASAVTFLQDQNVAGSPIENQIAFLQSKNLTNEEVDAALARSNKESSLSRISNRSSHKQPAYQAPVSGAHQQFLWQSPPPSRDWRDWFIMATVLSGLGYGMYNMVKRYVYPMIAPPTTPQLEQDKQAIEEKFGEIFNLVDQLAKDMDGVKVSEQARTLKLEASLSEIDGTLDGIKSNTMHRAREVENVLFELNCLRKMIPKALEEHKEATSLELEDLNGELKSLKILLSQRLNPSAKSLSSSFGRGSTSDVLSPGPQARNTTTDTLPTEVENKSSVPSTDEATSGTMNQASGHNVGIFSKGKPAIPSWQLAANWSTSHEKQADSEAEQ